MKKIRIITLISFISAFILGAWGQKIAYFLSDHIIDLEPINYLTAITIISVSLFLFSFVLSFHIHADPKLPNAITLMFQLFVLIVGVLMSFASLFVLSMWWS